MWWLFLTGCNVTFTISHGCTECFWREIWSTSGEITLPDCLFAPKIFLTLCTSACQVYEFAVQWAHTHNLRVLFTKLPFPILPLAWWLNSTACWDTFLLTARTAMRKIKLTHIPNDSDLAISMLLALGENVELESIYNPIFSSKMQALNQPLLYFKLSQMLFRCFEFDMAGLLNFYSYLFLSARLYSIRSKHTECWLLTLPCRKPDKWDSDFI